MPSEEIKNENFVSRWSRRKQDIAQKEQLGPEEAGEVVDLENTKEQKLAKLNALTDEDMPDVEALDEESDYAGFMSVNVSEGLRKLALQRLFHGKSYNIRDGLDEYDGDYTSFEKLDPSVITADIRHMMQVEAEKLLAKEEAEKQEKLLAEKETHDEQVIQELDDEGKTGDITEEEIVTSEPPQGVHITSEDVDEDEDLDLDIEGEELA